MDRPRLNRRPGYAVCVSAIAVALAVTASAVAAAAKPTMYSGANVVDNSLTGADFSATLTNIDFTATTATRLRVKGVTGVDGPQGADGNIGTKGVTGSAGVPAPKAYTFQTVSQSTRVKGNSPNPKVGETPDCNTASDLVVNCAGFSITTVDGQLRFPRWNFTCGALGKHCNVNAISVPRMTRTDQSLIVTSANASGGLLVMPYDGTILLNATATFYTQRTDSQQRLECQLQLARVENGVAQQAINVGAPTTIYRVTEGDNSQEGAVNRQERLLNIGVTGAMAQTAGVFETQLACRSLDDSGDPNDRLEFIEGNMSVLSTRSNGQA